MIRSNDIEKEALIMSERRDKCWRYSRNPEDKNDNKWFVLAFVNGKGRCSLTHFEAVNGKPTGKVLKGKGNYQDNFDKWLHPVSFPLYFSPNIDIVKARKEGLPA